MKEFCLLILIGSKKVL